MDRPVACLAGMNAVGAYAPSARSSRFGSGTDIWLMRARARAEAEEASLGVGLTRVEDNELRRLNWMAQRGRLTEGMRERIIELRLRDRRATIRRPRLVADE